jgi:hypothetical protein
MLQQFHIAHHGQGDEPVKAGMARQLRGTKPQVEIPRRDGRCWTAQPIEVGEVKFNLPIGRGVRKVRGTPFNDEAVSLG